MRGPIVSLAPCLTPVFVLFGLTVGVLVALPDRSPLLILATGTLLVALGSRQILRLMVHARHFQTASAGQIVLHHAPGLDAQENVPLVLQRCQAEVDRLTERFGFRLPGRVKAFLFARHQEVARIYGQRVAGFALSPANVIVIANDCPVAEMMRHELAHLYSARWNQSAPPLLNEGLSVWLQETESSRPIDVAARPYLDNRSLKLVRLLSPTFFFAEPQRHACYVLAGSFTGFLIRRYGWQRYGTLFRSCKLERFHKPFEECLGMDLEKAEREWRSEMILREALNLGSDDFGTDFTGGELQWGQAWSSASENQ